MHGTDWVNAFAIVVISGISIWEICLAWEWFHGESWERGFAWGMLGLAFGLNGLMITVNLAFILS